MRANRTDMDYKGFRENGTNSCDVSQCSIYSHYNEQKNEKQL